jgi:hypothetical protein
MAHEVSFEIPRRSLGKADISFAVKRGGTRFGTLKNSKGSLVWFPRDKQYGKKMSWVEFDDLTNRVTRTEKR